MIDGDKYGNMINFYLENKKGKDGEIHTGASPIPSSN